MDAIIEVLLGYLDDTDKVHVLLTCKSYARLIGMTAFTGMYELTSVRHLPFIANIRNIYYVLNHYSEYVKDPLVYEYVTYITTGKYFDKTIRFFPKNLKTIRFGGRYNKPIFGLPNTIRKIIFSDLFNQPVDDLSEGIKSLTFGTMFNQRVDHLPKSLKVLRLSAQFNQDIDNLPEGLEALYIDGRFNKRIDHLPSSLTTLHIGNEFNQSLTKLPNNLEVLALNTRVSKLLLFLPKKLRVLEILMLTANATRSLCYIPESVTTLVVCNQLLDPDAVRATRSDFLKDAPAYPQYFVDPMIA